MLRFAGNYNLCGMDKDLIQFITDRFFRGSLGCMVAACICMFIFVVGSIAFSAAIIWAVCCAIGL